MYEGLNWYCLNFLQLQNGNLILNYLKTTLKSQLKAHSTEKAVYKFGYECKFMRKCAELDHFMPYHSTLIWTQLHRTYYNKRITNSQASFLTWHNQTYIWSSIYMKCQAWVLALNGVVLLSYYMLTYILHKHCYRSYMNVIRSSLKQ
jgi:hypothetical protein